MASTGKDLSGKVALVTGGSRSIGKGIALELGHAGATVYVTARHLKVAGEMPGTAEETARQVTEAGGRGIAVQCDHRDDRQIAELIHRIESESKRLDVLVNNTFDSQGCVYGPDWPSGKTFWEAPLALWDAMMGVGLRSHYVATVLAMPALLKARGLVVNISSGGAYVYFQSVAYGVAKAALDRMTRDMAHELGERPVTVVSLWPGVVDNENNRSLDANNSDTVVPVIYRSILRAREVTARLRGTDAEADRPAYPYSRMTDPGFMESTSYVGRAVVALATDSNVRSKNGRALSVAGVASAYGFTDRSGTSPDAFEFRNVADWLPLAQRT